MGKVLREIDPEVERQYWERKIERAVSIYTAVRKRYSGGKFVESVFKHQYIHKQPRNMYHRILRNIIESLEELRAENTNPTEMMLEDYFHCVHEHYKTFHRVPYMQQLVPTDLTMALFSNWVDRWEEDHDQPYWITTVLTMEDISKRAAAALLAAQKAHIALVDAARQNKHQVEEQLLLEPLDTNVAKSLH